MLIPNYCGRFSIILLLIGISNMCSHAFLFIQWLLHLRKKKRLTLMTYLFCMFHAVSCSNTFVQTKHQPHVKISTCKNTYPCDPYAHLPPPHYLSCLVNTFSIFLFVRFLSNRRTTFHIMNTRTPNNVQLSQDLKPLVSNSVHQKPIM